jgi:hypothetical protein
MTIRAGAPMDVTSHFPPLVSMVRAHATLQSYGSIETSRKRDLHLESASLMRLVGLRIDTRLRVRPRIGWPPACASSGADTNHGEVRATRRVALVR